MFGHDGFMEATHVLAQEHVLLAKPTVIFIGDAALEEDYVLASLSWVSKTYQFYLSLMTIIMQF